MSKKSFKIEIDAEDVPRRNPLALDAMRRRSEKFKDRRAPRGGSRNWRHEYGDQDD
jgi:hypothetical protein